MKKSMIDVIKQLKFMSQAQLDEALSGWKSTEPIEDYLVRTGNITENMRAQLYGNYFEGPYIEAISERMADPDILGRVPFRFLRDNAVIPIRSDGDSLIIVTANPYSYQPIDDLKLLLPGKSIVGYATRSTILDALNKYYPLEGTKQVIEELEGEEALAPGVDFEAIREEDILGMAQEAPIIKLVNHILYQAVKRGASDIHIEPFEKELHVRYRIDGVLYQSMMPPKRTQAAITSRIKIMAQMNIAEKRQPQDGRIQIKIADKPIDIRVSVLPVAFGERIVMRLLDKSRTFVALQSLGFSEHDYTAIERAIHQPNGILFITGPTGSGKTSTLYSILFELNTPDVNIITVEDPVEYQMAGVGQVQVKEKIGLTFAAALRSILRQDPDIIMIGETRDQETAQIAIQAALTGHLVLSTLHTNNAPAAITRLIDMGVEPFLIASTIVAVIGQRLVRKLCDNCKKPVVPSADLLKRLNLKSDAKNKQTFYQAVGCDQCSNTGYRGRIALFEVMTMSHALAKLTVERADTTVLTDQAVRDGMRLLVDDGIQKARAGLTTLEEVLSVATVQEPIDE